MRSASIASVGTPWLPNLQSHPIFHRRPVQRRPLSLKEGFAMTPGQGLRFSVSSLEMAKLVSLVVMAVARIKNDRSRLRIGILTGVRR